MSEFGLWLLVIMVWALGAMTGIVTWFQYDDGGSRSVVSVMGFVTLALWFLAGFLGIWVWEETKMRERP